MLSFETCSLDVGFDNREAAVRRIARVGMRVAGHLDAIAAGIAAEAGATASAITLVLDHVVVAAGASGLGGWVRESRGMPAAWSPCLTVASHDRPRVIGDMHEEPGGVLRTATVFPELRSYAGVPMHADGHVVGAICVLDGRPGAFNEGTLHLLAAAGVRVHHLLGL
ncbi:GAF domain-containing protein [Actinoplanes sp. NPDC023714]|uniref:GAF domain-containing protein n=1 Tax=Actinoplanes sp. NPDC023714 TaxID=3154322 RepID=UPI0033DC98FF